MRIIFTLVPPLMVPILLVLGVVVIGVDLERHVPFMPNRWRLGDVIDYFTMIGIVLELARAGQIDRRGMISGILSMALPRTILGTALIIMPQLLLDPCVAKLATASLVAPIAAGALRVIVARRDIALAR